MPIVHQQIMVSNVAVTMDLSEIHILNVENYKDVEQMLNVQQAKLVWEMANAVHHANAVSQHCAKL